MDLKEIIQVNNVNKQFGTVTALNNVSFNFKGGLLGFIGPNGAGKSTLIKILLGLIKPSSGSTYMMGHDAFRDRVHIMRDVGVLHEKCIFPTGATGIEYLKYVGKFKCADMRTIDIACKVTNVSKYVNNPISSYSAGMLQRFGITDAILGFPKCVFLDEPTSNLDPLARKEILEKIWKLHTQAGMNFVISTHILPELEKVCSDILILNNGTQLAYGRIRQLMQATSCHNLEEIFVKLLERGR